MAGSQVTRGYGLLEGFLAGQRSRLVNSMIPDGHREGRLLDIGCGTYPLFLMGTEFNEKLGVEKFSFDDGQDYEGQNITLINHDIESGPDLPFDGNYLDVVTMLAVFEHIEPKSLVPLLKEIHRILKPGGLYLMTTPAFWTDKLLRVMAGLRLVSPVEIAEHKDAYSHAKISRLLAESGFDREKTRLGYFECFMNIWASAQK